MSDDPESNDLEDVSFGPDEKLPDGDEIFETYFAPWYEADDIERRELAGVRPDLEEGLPVGELVGEMSPLYPDDQQEVAEQIRVMAEAAAEDWPELLGVEGLLSLELVDAFDRHFNRAEVAEVIADADPEDYGSDLVVLCCELGSVLGEALRREAPELEWLYDWPYWESSLYDSRRGYRINVFDWAFKKFSEDGVEDGLRDKALRCLGLVRYGT